jgi:hypothetical protein
MGGAWSRSRAGISATAATLLGVLALLIGLLAFTATTVYLVRAAQAGSSIAGAYAGESKALVKVYAVLEMEKSGNSVLNKTYLIFENLWPDVLIADHIAVVSKSGSLIVEKDLGIILLKPGQQLLLKPSEIDPTLSIYDNDFWRFKREIGYIEMHVDAGGQGMSFKSYPEYRAEAGPLIIEPVYVTTTDVTNTVVIVTSTTTTITPTVTITTTCSLTSCSITRVPATAYTIVRVSMPAQYVTVTATVVRTNYYCITTYVPYTTWVTTRYTTVDQTMAGTISCAVCGSCSQGLYGSCPCPISSTTSGSPATSSLRGLYSIPNQSYQAVGQNEYPFHTLYFMAPIAALALAPTHMSPRRWRGLAPAVITLTMLALLIMPIISRGVKAQVTGATSTVASASTTTGMSTVTITNTKTVTTTSTKTITVTAPTSTKYVCSTSITTEYKCSGATVTLTFTEWPLIITTTTKYVTADCRYMQFPVYTITITTVYTSTRAVGYQIDIYSLRCGRWS